MIELKQYEVWFVTGSQHLYGQETLQAGGGRIRRQIAEALDECGGRCRSRSCSSRSLTTPDGDHRLCLEANGAPNCIGLITWMHTFSPAKMWIAGLSSLRKPLRAPAHAVQPRHPLGHASTWTS